MTTVQGIDFQALVDRADRDGVQRIVVGAVVHAAGRVLVLRRSGGDAFLPGIEELPSGGVDPGEDLPTALRRELAEEIGRGGPLALDPGFVTHFDYVSGSGRRARQYTFGLAHDGGPVSLSPEHTGFRWLAPADLAGSDVTEETARTVHAWAAARSNPVPWH
ncbi:hypothetical protein GCM10009678_72880 [Actinomadura kijaniata]|uniref:8-oxo-dGTP diphosphatase n=1 Tax=Actinomadura namibiensis TaxID=182080 RepID=A0A7W3M0H4_ACTNM|nr:NUDIX domain-containing protein [Actinomadura namibiensis]MBA8957540.1 8-oxo-dGTP diphosphatase [Actinomadura namibiensis]